MNLTDVKVERIEVADIRPGDTVIVRFPHKVTSEEAKRMAASFEGVFPENRVIFLSEGLEVEVRRT